MQTRQLGTTGIAISSIGLGCWQFSKASGIAGGFWGDLDDATIREIVRLSLEGGINWFDTAEAYGGGASEQALARALADLGKAPGEVVIATKWQPVFRFARSITATIDDRLAMLAPYPIDLYQVHNPFSFSGTTSQMNGMADLLDGGKVRAVGVSNFSAALMRKAAAELEKRGYRLASNQVKYSLLDRDIEYNGVLETARELGVTIIAYSPLEQGILTGKFHDDPGLIRRTPGYRRFFSAFKPEHLKRSEPLIRALRAIGERHNATAAQVALNWVISAHGETVVAIPGATKPQQAAENAGAMAFTLTRDEIDHLDSLSRVVTA